MTSEDKYATLVEAIEAATTAKWLLPDGYLPVKRQIYNSQTDQIDRSALRTFAPSSAEFFDLAYGTITMLNRMYAELSERWANTHPLLDHDVHLVRVHQLFREFSSYSLDLIRDLLVKEFQPNRQLGRVLIERGGGGGVNDIRANVVSKRTFDALRETLERDRVETARLRVENDRLIEELETLRDQREALDERAKLAAAGENDSPGVKYLRYLIEAKTVRRTVLRSELVNLLRFKNSTNKQAGVNARERLLVNTMLTAVSEIAKLRQALRETPTLFTGMNDQERVGLVVPRTINLFEKQTQSLLRLYYELYRRMTDIEVQRILSHSNDGNGDAK